MWLARTSDPVMDAENEQETKRQAYASCGRCGVDLYEEDETYYDDTSYFIDGMHICECCIGEYLQSKKRGEPCA